jgi:hypothetical protein
MFQGSSNEERLILATGSYIGEGFDDARPGVCRLHPGKVEVQVYDYVDSSVPILVKMHDKRMKGFKSVGYERAT